MKLIIIITVAFSLLFFSNLNLALAGDPGGPYVIWVNLSNNTSIDEMLDKRLKLEDDRVPPDSNFLFKKRPTGITNELVRKAVIKNDKKAIKLLDKLMHRPFGDFNKGFDGIIVYDEDKAPRLSQVVVGWLAVYSKKIPVPTDPNSVWDTFCILIPEVTRKP